MLWVCLWLVAIAKIVTAVGPQRSWLLTEEKQVGSGEDRKLLNTAIEAIEAEREDRGSSPVVGKRFSTVWHRLSSSEDRDRMLWTLHLLSASYLVPTLFANIVCITLSLEKSIKSKKSLGMIQN